MTEKWVKSKGNGSLFELPGLFELSEFELPGFYCIFDKVSIDCKDVF